MLADSAQAKARLAQGIERAQIVQEVLRTFERADGPVRYRLYDRSSRTTTRLFTDRPALARYTLAPMEPISFPWSS